MLSYAPDNEYEEFVEEIYFNLKNWKSKEEMKSGIWEIINREFRRYYKSEIEINKTIEKISEAMTE